jgi:hypothetical protein
MQLANYEGNLTRCDREQRFAFRMLAQHVREQLDVYHGAAAPSEHRHNPEKWSRSVGNSH